MRHTVLALLVLGAVALLGLSIVPGTATAGGPYDVELNYWYGSPFGGQYPVMVFDQAPPYFALHPPVYYSEPVARPYGRSPYAYQPAPGFPYTPLTELPQAEVLPQKVINPYVPQKPDAKANEAKSTDDNRVTSVPLRIINPFVESTAVTATVSHGVTVVEPQADPHERELAQVLSAWKHLSTATREQILELLIDAH